MEQSDNERLQLEKLEEIKAQYSHWEKGGSSCSDCADFGPDYHGDGE